MSSEKVMAEECDDESMVVLQILGIVLVAIGLILLYLEISGKKITESEYLGTTGPVGLVLVPVGVIMILLD